MRRIGAFVGRTLRAVRILARDSRIPKSLRLIAGIGLLPIPGPVDEAILILIAPVFAIFYRGPMREAWAQASDRDEEPGLRGTARLECPAVAEYSFERALRSLDDRVLFGYVPSETSLPDRRSLLALYNACHDHYGDFSYLEIGSYLGGSLQVLVADPRCTAITSIDPRPTMAPVEQSDPIPYPENSTERMLKYLEFVPGADLAKLRTIEASTEELSPGELGHTPRMCLVDGEHTVDAGLRDARFCRAAIEDEGVIVFHDRHLVRPAIDSFVGELEADEVPHESYPLPNALWVVSLGSARFLHQVQEMLAPWVERFAKAVAERAGNG